MNREELLQSVERLAPWFHRIELPHDVVTKAQSVSGEPDDHPLGTWTRVKKSLPEDLTGKTVLDVGCNAGFYAFEAKRRGAARVLGVDAQRHQVRQAAFVRKALSLPIELKRLSVYDLSRETVGTFDVVLALGLVYHCKHLVLALEKLFEVTGGLLILETAILPSGTFFDEEASYQVGSLVRNLHPLAYCENSADSKESVYNWFLPSPRAIQALARDIGFGSVEIASTGSGRAILVCRKDPSAAGALESRRARLSVESGPSATPFDAEMTFRLRVENLGLAVLRRDGVQVGAHLMRGEDEVAWNYGRARLPGDVKAGETAAVDITLLAPEEPGRYTIELDLVAENLSWFEDLGSPICLHEIEVRDEAPELPWFRREALLLALPSPVRASEKADLYRAVLGAVHDALAPLPPADAVRLLSEWTLGYVPDVPAVTFHASALEDDGGARDVARRFLARPDPKPMPRGVPGLERRRALGALADGTPAAGESFAGEAEVAAGLLSHARDLDDRAFVRFAYERLLGRQPDPAGEERAVARLLGKRYLRPYFLRDILWCSELRGP